jgi:hypothetical protein
MGLDIKCGDKSTRCGYRFVQTIRIDITLATISYLESINFTEPFQPQDIIAPYFIPSPHDVNKGEIDYDEQMNDFEDKKKKMIEFLIESLKSKNILNILNYQIWDNPNPIYKSQIDLENNLNFFGISGLQEFISHSDSEGYFSVGQSVDIMNLFSRINKFLKQALEKEDEHIKEMKSVTYNELIEIFRTSVDEKKYVLFM